MATKPTIGKTKATATSSIVTMRASRLIDIGRRPAVRAGGGLGGGGGLRQSDGHQLVSSLNSPLLKTMINPMPRVIASRMSDIAAAAGKL